MKRDVLLRLCCLIAQNPKLHYKKKHTKIRALLGMCTEHVIWKNHYRFLDLRILLNERVMLFRTSPKYGFVRGPDNYMHIKHAYRTVYLGTVVLDHQITEGFFRWTIRIRYPNEEGSDFNLGALNGRFRENIKLGYSKNTMCLSVSRRFCCCFIELAGKNCNSIVKGTTCVPQNSVIAIEADCVGHRLSFFVNGKKVSAVITGVRVPLYFGICPLEDLSFTSLSLCQLTSATVSNTVCFGYKMDYY